MEEIDTSKNLEPLGGEVGWGQGRHEACAGWPEKKRACAWGRWGRRRCWIRLEKMRRRRRRLRLLDPVGEEGGGDREEEN